LFRSMVILDGGVTTLAMPMIANRAMVAQRGAPHTQLISDDALEKDADLFDDIGVDGTERAQRKPPVSH
jgi:hypothetical protein